ncbi:hypothetical protein ICA16_05230 [Pseudomonas anatoliensis]|uniref:hypothetical protein n=1 Tax=Pseudomonas anatoliensis TaxID=2710589 RepID=UPI001B319A66|nr:hypothetical protein [Pseudomonas anatoliensis]MBP5955060.1 hypothetical protein [Pseudomonas anatoliensis]
MNNSQNISQTYYEDFEAEKTPAGIPETGYTTTNGLTLHVVRGDMGLVEEYDDKLLNMGPDSEVSIKLSVSSTQFEIAGMPGAPTTITLHNETGEFVGDQIWKEDTKSFTSAKPVTYLRVYCDTPGAEIQITRVGWSE